jgi:NAD(P)-dependent dehydrogenase (short-subunit alcohol dehydrogenase family)
MSTEPRTVVVTGAGSGIGAATTLHLDRLGLRVFAGVHDPADADVLAKQVSGRSRVGLLDVTDPASIERYVAGVAAELGEEGLDALVNNAGQGVAGPLESVGIDDLRRQLDVNVVGQVAVTQQALRLLRRGRPGRVVFIGSLGGRVAAPLAGAYHASKHAIEAIGDAWRQELAPDGIQVVIIEPGPVATPIWAKAVRTLDRLPDDERYRERVESFKQAMRRQSKEGMSPEKVAELIEHAVTAPRPHARYPGGLVAKVGPAARWLLPDRVFDRIARRATTGRQAA